MLNQLQSSHIGIEGCVRRAREFCSGQEWVLKLETLSHGVQSAKHTVQHMPARSFNYMNVLRALGRKLPLICLFLGSDISDYGGLLVQFLWSSSDPQEDNTKTLIPLKVDEAIRKNYLHTSSWPSSYEVEVDGRYFRRNPRHHQCQVATMKNRPRLRTKAGHQIRLRVNADHLFRQSLYQISAKPHWVSQERDSTLCPRQYRPNPSFPT